MKTKSSKKEKILQNVMMFTLGASSLHHDLETLPTEEKSSFEETIHTIRAVV